MSRTTISVEKLGKEYVIGGREIHGDTFREMMVSAATAPFRRLKRLSGEVVPEERIWALKDVSFEVEEGEVVGIIGHNGAGKSTLLKMLSRIAAPTEGRIRIRGRVSSLLEVGTGFHPELTGRENIYLNGAILGMSRAEINRKFDGIVDFSGVEMFLDTPVKRYSSGMQVRLAFAVAAHLDPEILIVDEVLAVGDAEFQRKCLGKMDNVAHSGRTVLMVSHNMAAVESLCSKCLLLGKGSLVQEGRASDVISLYLNDSAAFNGQIDLSGREDQESIIRCFRILNSQGRAVSQVALGEECTFEIKGYANRLLKDVTLNIRIDSITGERVTVCHTYYQYNNSIVLQKAFRMSCRLKNVRLMPTTYRLTLILKSQGLTVDQAGPIKFEVVPTDVYGTGKSLPARTGNYIPEAKWEIETGYDGFERFERFPAADGNALAGAAG